MTTKSTAFQIKSAEQFSILQTSSLGCENILKDGVFDTLVNDSSSDTSKISSADKEKAVKTETAKSFCKTDLNKSSNSFGVGVEGNYGLVGGGVNYNESKARETQTSNCQNGSDSLTDDQVDKIYNSMEQSLKNFVSQKIASPVIVANWNQCNQMEADRQKFLIQSNLTSAEIAAKSQKDLLDANLEYLKTKDEKALQVKLLEIQSQVPKIGLRAEVKNLDKNTFTMSLSWNAFKGLDNTTITSFSILNAATVGAEKVKCGTTLSSKESQYTYRRANKDAVFITLNTLNDSFTYMIPAIEPVPTKISISSGLTEVKIIEKGAILLPRNQTEST